MGTAEVAAVTAVQSVQGTLETGGGEGKGQGHWGLGSQGKGAEEKEAKLACHLGEAGIGMYGVGARNSPNSVQLPDRPQRTLLIPEAELRRPRDRDSEHQRRGEKEIRARCP